MAHQQDSPMVKMPTSSGVNNTELCIDGMNRLGLTEHTGPAALAVPRPTVAAPAAASGQPFAGDNSAQKSAKTRVSFQRPHPLKKSYLHTWNRDNIESKLDCVPGIQGL